MISGQHTSSLFVARVVLVALTATTVFAYNVPVKTSFSRRSFLSFTSGVAVTAASQQASASTFTPGGTLVEREVGIQVDNAEASPSRAFDNNNVLFSQDYYYKFGNAAQWIEPGSTEYPKTMPFTLSQQRYDALKKYGDRAKKGLAAIDGLGAVIESTEDLTSIPDGSASDYALRPLGLLANGFIASENTGTTNELLLARWYINEMYLAVGDVRNAKSKAEAKKAYGSAKKAANSYLTMLNRVITAKVGDKFEYLN